MGALLTLLWLLVGSFALWIFYLAIMTLQRANDAGQISPVAYRLGKAALYIGLLLDFLGNVIVLSILVLELPRWREWLVTARLRRLVHTTGWRRSVARWLSIHLLNDFDSRGPHVPL